MEWLKCENEECGAMYFTDTFEGAECLRCKNPVSKLPEKYEGTTCIIPVYKEYVTTSC